MNVIDIKINDIKTYWDDKNVPFTIQINNGKLKYKRKKITIPFKINYDTVVYLDHIPNKIYAKYILYLCIFFIIGVPISLISPKIVYNFFHKKLDLDIFNYKIFSVEPKWIKHFFLRIYSIFLFIYIPYILLNIKYIYETEFDLRVEYYNWSRLFNSLMNNGYKPKKFHNGWIKVIPMEDKNGYRCVDGNHRTFLLKHIYKNNLDKKITVLLDN